MSVNSMSTYVLMCVWCMVVYDQWCMILLCYFLWQHNLYLVMLIKHFELELESNPLNPHHVGYGFPGDLMTSLPKVPWIHL